MNTGEKIVLLRKKYNYTQQRLADEIGISRATMSKVEKGESVLDFDSAARIASLFDVSLEELYYGYDTRLMPNHESIVLHKVKGPLSKGIWISFLCVTSLVGLMAFIILGMVFYNHYFGEGNQVFFINWYDATVLLFFLYFPVFILLIVNRFLLSKNKKNNMH